MIKSHQSSILRRLFSSTKENKNCPRYKLFRNTNFFPTPCFTNETHRQHCVCKRRRKDIDKRIILSPIRSLKEK